MSNPLPRCLIALTVLALVLAFGGFGVVLSSAHVVSPIRGMEQDFDAASRQSKDFYEVAHKALSYYVRPCLRWEGGQCVRWGNPDRAYRFATGYIQRLRTGLYDGGLVWATLAQTHQNVQTSYPRNDPSTRGTYHHCPRDGSADGTNQVGWDPEIDLGFGYGESYVTASYDLPTGSANHVSRPDGLTVTNDVFTTSTSITWGMASSWSYVDICNVARHYQGQSGWEVRLVMYSYTWDPEQAWWGGWSNYYYWDQSIFYLQF